MIDSASERERTARVCLLAARSAHAAGAYSGGRSYSQTGLAILATDAWRGHPDATFELTFVNAQCAWPLGDYEAAARMFEALLARAETRVRRVLIHREQIELALARVDLLLGFAAIVECMRLFGLVLPLQPTPEVVLALHLQVERRLGARSIEGIASLPSILEPELRALLHVLRTFATAAFALNRPLRDLVACQMMLLTLEHGLSEGAPHAAVHYGGFLAETLERLDDAYRYSCLARVLIERPELTSEKARVLNFCVLVENWKRPPSELVELCQLGYQVALDSGDRLSTCFHAMQLTYGRIAQGRPLSEILDHANRGIAMSRDIDFRYVVDAQTCALRFALALRGQTTSVESLGGDDFDEEAFRLRLEGQPFGLPIYNYWLLALEVRYIGGDYAGAWDIARRIADIRAKAVLASPLVAWTGFFGALAAAALIPRTPVDARAPLIEALRAEEAHLARLVDHAPHNFRSKYLLLRAERARLAGDYGAVLPLYEDAIRAARAAGFNHEEAIACELAARFLVSIGVEIGARAYWRKAYQGYVRWGASGKLRLLEQQVPELAALAETRRPPRVPASELDVMALSLASQAIAGELILERLVPLLIRITVESTGARRGHLLLFDGEGTAIRAGFDATSGAESTEQIGADTPGVLAWSVVRYAQRTGLPVLVDDATTDRRFSSDPYVLSERPRSVLCVPIVRRQRPVGALYLDNNLIDGAFTPNRVALVAHLAAQAAVSLDNARLFGELLLSEARIDTLVGHAPIALYATDAQGIITVARGRALGTSGHLVTEMLGRSIFDCFVDAPWIVAATTRALAGEAVSASGQLGQAWVELQSVPVREGLGRISGSTGILIDITARARLAADLRRLATESLAAEDSERRRIARDLHDSVGQSLPALKLELEALATECSEPAIAVAAAKLGVIHQQLRTLTFELYPAMLDDLGLFATLERHCRKLAQDGLKVSLDEVGERRPLLRERATFVFRAARELLRNVAKHAQATEAMVSLTWRPGALRVVVADDGVGFDPSAPWLGGGLGLFDLRERVTHLGGRLQVDSLAGRGTEVTLDIPFEQLPPGGVS